MPLYQLPNGRVVYLTMDQYLDMSDQDLRDLNAGDCGDYLNPQRELAANKKTGTSNPDRDCEIDYEAEYDDIPPPKISMISITVLTVDDIPATESLEDFPEEEQD